MTTVPRAVPDDEVYRRVEVDSTFRPMVRERKRVPLPPGTVRLAVEFCSVNRGDLERIRGSYGGVSSKEIGFWRTESGSFVPGYEPAGVVVEVAGDVDRSLLGR